MGLLPCLALLAVVAFAQPYEGRRISAIRFSPEQQTIPDAELRQLLPLKVGETFDGVRIREAMAALYKTGRYSNLIVDAVSEGDAVILTFVTENNEFAGSVDVEGTPGALAKGGLINAAKLPLGSLFDASLLNQSVEAIETELRLEGFYESKVRYELIRDTTHQQVNIRFFIDAGNRAHFARPVFHGNLLLTEDQLIGATHWRPFGRRSGWRYFSDQKVQSGIRNILQRYRKRDLLMAKAVLERVDYEPTARVAIPSLRIEAGPTVEVRTIGAKLPKSELRKLVPIYQEQTIDKDLLVEGNRNLIGYLRGKGYFDAKVSYEVEQDSQPVDEIDLKKNTYVDYNIERGLHYKVAELILLGNRYFDKATLLERMSIRPATKLRYRHGRYSDEMLAADKNAIEELYRANGFLAAKVATKVSRQNQGQEGQVAVSISIAEGPQTKIEEVRLEGIADSDKGVIQGYLSASTGQPYSVLTINSDRERVLNLLYQTGFSEATFEVKVEKGTGPDLVELVYTIQGGVQHFVRDVVVSGLKNTNPSLVEKRIKLKAGDPLNNTEVFASQRRLYDLGIFARVDTKQQNPDGDEISKILLFNLEEASKLSFNGGLGAEIARIGGDLTSFDSPAGGAGFSPRISFGVNRSNFLGLGHTIGAQTRLSNIQRRVLLTYLAPQFRDNDRFNLTATGLFDDARNVRTFNSRRLEGSLQLAQRLSLANMMQYRFTYRLVKIDKNTIKVDPSLIPLLSQPVRVGSISSTFIQDRRDDPADAHKGRFTTADFGVASKAFGSSANFMRLITKNSTYYRIGKDIVFARSTNIGILAPYLSAGVSSQADVPLPERFFGGGAYSHRGFPENQAGPRDLKTGFPLGGKALFFNNFELRFPLIGDNLGGVIFHDAGNVYSDVSKVSFNWKQKGVTDFDYMVHAIGFGVRYRTPIGPVRIDLAFTPNSPRFNGFEGSRQDLLFGRGREASLRVNQFQFHISLGQAF